MADPLDTPIVSTWSSVITGISAILSILSGLIIIWSYRQFPQIQNYTRYLLVCLTVADVATAFGNLSGTVRWIYLREIDARGDFYCTGQSLVTTTSSLCSFFYTTTIAIYLFAAVVSRVDLAKKRTLKFLMTCVPIVVPVAITGTALGYGVLGEDNYSGSGPWCWIRSSANQNLMWKLMTGKAWEILAYIVTLFIFVLLKFFTWRENRLLDRRRGWGYTTPNLRDADDIFGISWLFLLVARIWGTMRFILQTVEVTIPNTPSEILLYFQCFGDSSQAFFNFLFFFSMDPILRNHILTHKWWFLCREHINFERLAHDVADSDELTQPVVKN